MLPVGLLLLLAVVSGTLHVEQREQNTLHERQGTDVRVALYDVYGPSGAPTTISERERLVVELLTPEPDDSLLLRAGRVVLAARILYAGQPSMRAVDAASVALFLALSVFVAAMRGPAVPLGAFLLGVLDMWVPHALIISFSAAAGLYCTVRRPFEREPSLALENYREVAAGTIVLATFISLVIAASVYAQDSLDRAVPGGYPLGSLFRHLQMAAMSFVLGVFLGGPMAMAMFIAQMVDNSTRLTIVPHREPAAPRSARERANDGVDHIVSTLPPQFVSFAMTGSARQR